jgi:hypothetical protein
MREKFLAPLQNPGFQLAVFHGRPFFYFYILTIMLNRKYSILNATLFGSIKKPGPTT